MVFNCSLDHSKNYYAAFGSTWGIGKQKILPVNDKGLYAALCTVIAELHPTVLQIIGQVRPLLLQIGQCFS